MPCLPTGWSVELDGGPAFNIDADVDLAEHGRVEIVCVCGSYFSLSFFHFSDVQYPAAHIEMLRSTFPCYLGANPTHAVIHSSWCLDFATESQPKVEEDHLLGYYMASAVTKRLGGSMHAGRQAELTLLEISVSPALCLNLSSERARL